MNYYFLLEDSKSFIKVLPKWLEYCGFKCQRVADITEVEKDNYVLQSGQGVTQLVTKVLFDTIETIISNPQKIDKLIVILDAEELTVEDRKQQVTQKINEKYKVAELDFDIEIIVCNCCFETWLLGHKGLYPKETVSQESAFFPYYCHYDIEKEDPELMCVPTDIQETKAKYHFHYLHELFRFKRIRYNKKKPEIVASQDYLEGIIARAQETNHVTSFKSFYEFICEEIRNNM